MENKNIIIILVIVIIALAAIVGAMFLQQNTKEPSKLKITSNKTLYEGDSISVQLTDLNKTALSNQKVNITITDKNGKVVLNKTVETNSKGKAKLDLDLKKGKYNVTVAYGGNDNFTGNTTTQNLTIKEKVVEVQSTQTQPTASDDDNYYNGYSRSDFSEGQQAAIDDARAHGYSSPAAYHQATGKTAGQAYIDSHPEQNHMR